jgi:hypothetical protein
MRLPSSLVVLSACAVATFAAVAAPAPTSEFSSTDPQKSKRITSGEAEGSFLCPGFGGYQIIFSGGDDRSWIELQVGQRTVHLSGEIFAACPGVRPWKANHVVQWRGVRKGNQFIPYALIFRMYSENQESSKRRYDTLVVVKLDGENSHVVGQVAGDAKNGNTAAEQLADRLCLSSDSDSRPVQTSAPSTPEASSPTAAATGVSVTREETGTTSLRFPNGQRFTLPPGKGILGSSEDPGSGKPFEIEEGWLVGANEQPETKASIVHLYLKGKNGKWTEIDHVQQRILKVASSGGRPLDSGFVRINSMGLGWPNTVILQIEYFTDDPHNTKELPIAVSRTGNISYGSRGE